MPIQFWSIEFYIRRAILIFAPVANATTEEGLAPNPVLSPPTPTDQRAVAASNSSQTEKFRLSVFILYNEAEKLKESGTAKYLGNSYSFNAEEISESAFGTGLSLEKKQRNNFGIDFGIAGEFKRKIKSYKINLAGIQDSGNYDSPPSMTLLYVFMNGRYYLQNDFYILGGLNVTKAEVSNSSINLKMGLGWQLGIGTELADNVSLEFQYKTLAVKGTDASDLSGSPLTADYDKIELNGLTAIVRYIFQ